MSTYYNETLHDKTGSFLYEAIRSTTYLSEGACDDIRKLFRDEIELVKFIRANVDVTREEAWELVDQVYPTPRTTELRLVDEDGQEVINARAFM